MVVLTTGKAQCVQYSVRVLSGVYWNVRSRGLSELWTDRTCTSINMYHHSAPPITQYDEGTPFLQITIQSRALAYVHSVDNFQAFHPSANSILRNIKTYFSGSAILNTAFPKFSPFNMPTKPSGALSMPSVMLVLALNMPSFSHFCIFS